MGRDPSRVPAIAVRAATELGFDGAAFRVLDEDSASHWLLDSIGHLAEAELASSLSATITDLVLERGERVIARRSPGPGEVPLRDPAAGELTAVAVPIWIQGWIAGVLIGTAVADIPEDAVAGLELLAFQSGLISDNARAKEEGRDTATRLEEGDRLKTEFLTTISHEMRTPLTVLMGNGLTLQQTWSELDDESRLGLLSGMNVSVRTLDGMLTDLLDFARLEAGELWVSFEPFPIGRVLRSACARARETLGERSLEIRVEGDPLASGDAVLIRRVISALLANAGTHTPDGTTVTASCARRADEVVIEIADDGPGIQEHDLPFIGERFYRGGDVNTRPRGLGLGLALALGILDLHESTLSAENGPDGGARFSFALPWVPDPADPRPKGSHDPGLHARAPGHGQS
jgi:signal transduction histidine kinase